MKKAFKTKKITLWITIFVLLTTSFLIVANKIKPLNNSSKFETSLNISDSNGDYYSQQLNLLDIDSSSPMKDNEITTTLILSDNRVFMGGKDGNWAIQTIVDGKSSGDPMSGKIEGDNGNIVIAVKEYDYKTNSKIILGFDTGAYFILDTTSGQQQHPFNEENLKSDDLNKKIVDISYTGFNNDYYFITEKGEVFRMDIDSDTHKNDPKAIGKMDDDEIITIKNEGMIGTSKGKILRYNVNTGNTTNQSPGDSLSTSPITSITSNGSRVNYLLTQDDGSWTNLLLTESQTPQAISSGQWGGGEKSILTSIKINDYNNSEFLVVGESGHWEIIDFAPEVESDPIVVSGDLSSGNNINTIINIGGNDQSMFLFGEKNGTWNTFEPIGNIVGFDKSSLPEEISVSDGKLVYKISTKSDYPNWPLNVKKYKIQSTLHDEKNDKDIVNTSETFDTFGEKIVEIDSLLYGNEYSDLRVQLVEEDGTTPIGNEWKTGVSFKTEIGKVSDIVNASIKEGDVYSNGFKLTIDEFDCSKGDPLKVLPYTLDVFATVAGENEESVIWTSLLQTTAIDGESFIIDTLDPGIEYTDVSVQINYDGTYVGTKFSLVDSLTTKNIPLSLSGTFSEITSDGFKISTDIDAENPTKLITDGYYMHVTSDGINYTSEKKYQAGNDVEFEIGNLDHGQRYNVRIWMSWDEDGNEPIPNCNAIVGWVTIENHVKEIKSASIDDKLTTSNSITINSSVSADNDLLNTTTPFTIKVFDVKNDSSKDLLYETIPLSESGDLGPIVVPNLTLKTTYNIKLQLLENKVEIGGLFNVGEVTTHSSEVTNINKIEVEKDSITSEGFDIRINIDSEYGETDVDSYQIRLYGSKTKEKPIWTGKSSTAGVQTFTVNGLDSSHEYTDTTYVLWDVSSKTEVDRVSGPDVTTLGMVSSVDNIKISNVKDTNFNMEVNVNDTFENGEFTQNNEPHKVEDYWIWVFANGDDINPIWKSKNSYGISGLVEFNVDNLDTNTSFNDIKIRLAKDKEGTSFSGEIQKTNLSIKTKMSHKLIEGITIGLIIFIIISIIVIYFSTIFYIKSRRNREERLSQTLKFNI